MRRAPEPAPGVATRTPSGGCGPGALAQRLKQQAVLLDRAAGLVKPGGRIAYVTCSVLAEENDDQVQRLCRPER